MHTYSQTDIQCLLKMVCLPACPRNGCKIDIEPAPLTLSRLASYLLDESNNCRMCWRRTASQFDGFIMQLADRFDLGVFSYKLAGREKEQNADLIFFARSAPANTRWGFALGFAN